MPLTFDDILRRLGVSAKLNWDDADPVCLYDEAERMTWMGEVRIGTEDEEITAEVVVIDGADRWHLQAQLRFEPDDKHWTVAGLTVTGKPVTADPAAAIAFTAAVLADIRATRVPDVGALLLQHLGLTLPITGYR